ncbi:hypothetical protein JRO89_XS09G0111300 [Xanthoceras sorbifolium]|uniref:SNRNP25 ubiquitin-like domain-containing protein n=1 Tax=Xanthoceras sorbifolium TaxID=99658 RepID=A0ABQ8HL26_9ROSI|nr:hypothetical protein JRO89_XS09G0111300 [Xanthoceras sorbifolium]
MVRVLLERRCVAPLTLNDSGDDDDDLVQTLSYLKLPQSRLRLSVLKLDGSLFDVNVQRNATVEELKQAIEEVFTSSPREGQGKISWTHVWGHFCLCYKGSKLMNDKARIRDFRIKDGDQVAVRILLLLQIFNSSGICPSTTYIQKDLKPRVLIADSTQVKLSKEKVHHGYLVDQIVWSSSGSDADEATKLAGFADKDSLEDQDGYKHNHNQCQDAEKTPASEFKLAHFLRGWLSYSRLWGVSRKSSEVKNSPSRFSLHCLGGSSRMIQRSG